MNSGGVYVNIKKGDKVPVCKIHVNVLKTWDECILERKVNKLGDGGKKEQMKKGNGGNNILSHLWTEALPLGELTKRSPKVGKLQKK